MLLQADQGPPRFALAGPVVAGALAELRFPERIRVSQAADRHRKLDNPGAYSGWWRESPHDLRFAERAMDALGADSPFSQVVVMGPAQTAKSEVGNNWQLHTLLYDPADMLFVMPDRVAIDEYVKTQWSKMVDPQLHPDLAARLLGGPSADNINLKQFRGCSFFFRWPTGPTFRAKPIARGRLDDYDDIPQDVGAGAGGEGGQGDPLSLMLGRDASFDAYGGTKVYANSSPKLGKRRGIEALVAAGTDERWHVDCQACGEPFILDTETCLQFDRTGTPAAAGSSAVVFCPAAECGGFHRQQDKPALMASGRWVGRGETAVSRKVDPAGKRGELVQNRRLSQRWDGLMGFRRWSRIAEQWREAELAYENEQDEAPLKTFFQTVAGKNYVVRGTGEPSVTEEELLVRARASSHRFGLVPREASCLIMTVDQQGNRFEVGAWAFAAGYLAWLIDRFAIVHCGDEPLRPFQRPEHFSVLYDKVLTRTYPIAGAPTSRIKPLGLVLDTGGSDGATDNAFAWWHSMVKGDVGSGRAPVPPTALMLFKGGNKPSGKLLPPPLIDARRQLKGAPQCELYLPNVNRLKDMAEVGLRRGDGGPGSITFPGDVDKNGELLAARYIAEMKAETKEGEIWVRPPHTANETLDLYVMARSFLLRFGDRDHSLGWVPAWARPPRSRPQPAANDGAAAEAAMREAVAEQLQPQEPPPPAKPLVQTAAPRRLNAGGRPRVRVTRSQ